MQVELGYRGEINLIEQISFGWFIQPRILIFIGIFYIAIAILSKNSDKGFEFAAFLIMSGVGRFLGLRHRSTAVSK
jgi:hypothetical protein